MFYVIHMVNKDTYIQFWYPTAISAISFFYSITYIAVIDLSLFNMILEVY